MRWEEHIDLYCRGLRVPHGKIIARTIAIFRCCGRSQHEGCSNEATEPTGLRHAIAQEAH
jgi:hypothetical protein